MRSLFYTILFLGSILSSCNNPSEKSNHEHKHDHEMGHHHKHVHGHEDQNISNRHMHESSFEELSASFESDEREAWQKPDLVIEKLGDLKGKMVADIGAGTGYFSFRLAEKEAEVIAIDVDQRFIEYINNKKSRENIDNVTTRLVGYDNPELEAVAYDALIIVDTYHHFNNKVEYMMHCFRGLKKDGVLINVDFKKEDTLHGPPIDHRIAAEEVKADLIEAGFSEVSIDNNTLSEQYIMVAVK